MDDKRYRELADTALREILDLFDEVDVDDADAESSGDVVTVRYRDGSRLVVNTQSPAKQMWLAGAGRGWHFSWDEERGGWLHDKGTGDELFAVLRQITKDTVGVDI
jgi:CyaY protein